MSGTRERLFVYGTLTPERAPPGLREVVARFVWEGAATVRGRLYDLGAYPGLVIDATAEPVAGRLARLPHDPGLWPLLDRYEGVGEGLFRRVRCRAEPSAREAWVYEYARAPGGARRIAAWS